MNTTRHTAWFTRAPAFMDGAFVAPVGRMAYAGVAKQPA